MNKYIFVISALSLLGCALFAEDSSAKEGAWTFSAGPAWRNTVKMETHGAVYPPATAKRSTTSRDMSDAANWTGESLVADPMAGKGGIPKDGKLWGVSDVRNEVKGVPGRIYLVDDREEEDPAGLNLQACYDFICGSCCSVGLGIRLAGYWGMEATTYGYFDAGSTRTEKWRENYVFPDLSPEADFLPDPEDNIEHVSSTMVSSHTDKLGSRAIGTRLRADLYQVGIGPKATWHALGCLDVYGGIELLGNLSRGEFDADGASCSQTDFLLGVGGNLGLGLDIADGLGIYGQVGYEWIEKAELAAGGFNAEIDYSSLVLSAGIQLEF